ncbi:DUF413 domain-containing protein [Alteromonas sediminis]|nr:DUF413 domain-containing protein [Alteromonas sediminis]
MNGFRQTSKTFLDAKNYPRGFKKSGDFSIAESDILSQLGVTLEGLSNGSLQPESEEELRLVSVLQGQAEAESKVEKTWLKYKKLTLTPRKFYTLYSSNRSVTTDDDFEEDTVLDYDDA